MKSKNEFVNDLLLDVLHQACGISETEIDNHCLSAFEGACIYLEKVGLLKKVNERIYRVS